MSLGGSLPLIQVAKVPNPDADLAVGSVSETNGKSTESTYTEVSIEVNGLSDCCTSQTINNPLNNPPLLPPHAHTHPHGQII